MSITVGIYLYKVRYYTLPVRLNASFLNTLKAAQLKDSNQRLKKICKTMGASGPELCKVRRERTKFSTYILLPVNPNEGE